MYSGARTTLVELDTFNSGDIVYRDGAEGIAQFLEACFLDPNEILNTGLQTANLEQNSLKIIMQTLNAITV